MKVKNVGTVVLKLSNVSTVQNVSYRTNKNANKVNAAPADRAADMELNIKQVNLHQLWQQDHFCIRTGNELQTSRLQSGKLYFIEYDLLMRNVTDNKQYSRQKSYQESK